jgi:hypothetical protein
MTKRRKPRRIRTITILDRHEQLTTKQHMVPNPGLVRLRELPPVSQVTGRRWVTMARHHFLRVNFSETVTTSR